MKRLRLYISIAALLILSLVLVLPVSAEAIVTDYSQSCSHFWAKGTTDQPYIVVEVFSWIDEAANTWIDYSWIVVPSNGDGTFEVYVTFPEQSAGTIINYWLWGSPVNSINGWDSEDWYDSGDVPCTLNPAAPGIPSGFVLHNIHCDTPVYQSAGGSPVPNTLIRAGQTWYVNPTPVDGSDGQQWTEIFNSGRRNGYIPTVCVGGTV